MSGEMFEVVGEATYDEDTDTLLRDGSAAAIVEICDVFPDAVKVEAGDLRLDDLFFDAFGGTHPIVDIKRRKGSPWVRTERDDGWVDQFHSTDIVTIIRPNQEV